MNKETLLRLDKVSVSYGEMPVLHDVDIEVDEGEVVAVMGPNGAGKSTVLKGIFGLAKVVSGEVRWHEKPINPVPHEVVHRGISYVPQGRQIFHSLSVEENLEMGGFTVKDPKLLRERIERIMELFPILETKRKQKAGGLSGGQQQMLALARGLITDPKVLLLDEPSLGLAPKIVKEVFQKIKEINEKHKTAIVIVEHNIKSVLEIVDRAYVLDHGRVAATGDGRELIESDTLKNIFMGKHVADTATAAV